MSKAINGCRFLKSKIYLKNLFPIRNRTFNKIQRFIDQCQHRLFGECGVAAFNGVEDFCVIFHYAFMVAFDGAGVADADAQGGGDKITQANIETVVARVEDADVKGDIRFQIFFAIAFGFAHAFEGFFNII